LKVTDVQNKWKVIEKKMDILNLKSTTKELMLGIDEDT